MKTFIWINGKEVKLIKAESLEAAVTKAENLSDHSKEVIVREYDNLTNVTGGSLKVFVEDNDVPKFKKILKVCAKCRDLFAASIEMEDGNLSHDGYVPDFMPGNHYGDYVEIDIDIETGQIVNWVKPTDKQLRTQMNGE